MGTHYEGTESEIIALNAFINLLRATESLGSRLSPLLAQSGLTPSQWGTLETLFHLGSLCQRDLSQKLLKSGGNITQVVNNLERGELVQRSRNPKDRRQMVVALTPAGRKLVRRLIPKVVARIEQEMSALDHKELETLRKLCRRLGKGESCEPFN